MILVLLIQRQVRYSAQQLLRIDDVVAYGLRREVEVAFSAGYELCQHEIVGFHAPACRLRLLVNHQRHVHGDKAVLPSTWRLGGLGTDAMCVIAERLVELRSVAHGPVDLDRLLGSLARIHVGLLGEQQRCRGIWVLPQDRLAADYDDLVLARYRGGRPDHVFELIPFHAGSSSTAASARRRKGSLSVPAKGEFWRRSRMCWVSLPIRCAISAGGLARIVCQCCA